MLERLTHPALTAPHGFFTRRGGASSGIFAGLNCGLGSSDQAEIVIINRTRAAAELGAPVEMLLTLHQTHSATALAVDAPFTERPKADALVTATPGLLLGVVTADCQPVLFQDPEAGVIGAAHAGWKGALDGVLEATVAGMERLGARRTRIRAVIGPTISQPAYEVGPEFRDRFLAADPGHARYFAANSAGRFQFDLPGFGLDRLAASGIASAAWTGHCTYRDADRFFSYRRATHEGAADYGRLLSAIRL